MHADNAEGSRFPDVEFSPDEEAVLIGTVLGDGALAMHGRNARLFVKHKAAHKALASFKRQSFERFGSMELHEFDQILKWEAVPVRSVCDPDSSGIHGLAPALLSGPPKGCAEQHRRSPHAVGGGCVVHGRWVRRSHRRDTANSLLHS